MSENATVLALQNRVGTLPIGPGAWERLRQGLQRRQRVRRAGFVALALTASALIAPTVGLVSGYTDRSATLQFTGPAGTTQPAQPIWPLVDDRQISAWRDDPIIGSIPDITSPHATALAFSRRVLGIENPTLTVTEQGGGRASVDLARAGRLALVLDVSRVGAEGPWLITDARGETLTITRPVRDAAVDRGSVMIGTAPVSVASVYVRFFWPDTESAVRVPVSNGRWSVVIPKDVRTGRMAATVQLQPEDGVDVAATTVSVG